LAALSTALAAFTLARFDRRAAARQTFAYFFTAWPRRAFRSAAYFSHCFTTRWTTSRCLFVSFCFCLSLSLFAFSRSLRRFFAAGETLARTACAAACALAVAAVLAAAAASAAAAAAAAAASAASFARTDRLRFRGMWGRRAEPPARA